MAAMTPAAQRKAQRVVHLAAAVVLIGYLYAPIGAQLQDLVRLVVLPLLAATGIAMWQAARIRRIRKAAYGRAKGGKVRPRAGSPDPDAPASRTGAGRPG